MAAREGRALPSCPYWTEGNRTRQGRGGVERWKKSLALLLGKELEGGREE